MSFTFTPIATENFSPDANPLNPANWTTFTGLSALQAVGGKCEVSNLVSSCGEYYSGSSFPNDQYASFVLNALSGGGDAQLALRAASDISTYYSLSLSDTGTPGTATITVASNAGVIHTDPSFSYSLGDTILFAVIGTSLYVFQNGVQIILVTDSSVTSGHIGVAMDASVSASDVQISNVVMGSAAVSSGAYSQPDCRNFATFPNTSRNVNGTLTYDVQTSSNSAVPGTDSRTSVPVASGTYPQNSRTPGTYGPGE